MTAQLTGGIPVLVLTIEDDSLAAHYARQLTTQALHGHVGAKTLDDVLLGLTELVANAQRHGAPPARLAIHRQEDGILISVSDALAKHPTRSAPPDTGGGFGLRLIGSVTTDWGTETLPVGKAVWGLVVSSDAAPEGRQLATLDTPETRHENREVAS